MKAETIRNMDELGRIVVPGEMRSALGWNKESRISITRQGDQLLLQTFRGSCFVCGSEDKLQPIQSKSICQTCIDAINCKL